MEMQKICKDFEQSLVLYYYGECPAEERGKIETHLKSCSACSGFLAELSQLLPLTVKADEPPQRFWEDYSREMRRKIAAVEEKRAGWRGFFSFLPAWPVPAVATALVLLIAVTLTFTQGRWRQDQLPSEEKELLEMIAMGQSFEFLTAMDLLESMDLLEAMGAGNGSA